MDSQIHRRAEEANDDESPPFRSRTAALLCLAGALIGGATLGVGALGFAIGEAGWTPDPAQALREVRAVARGGRWVAAGLAVVGAGLILGGVVIERRKSHAQTREETTRSKNVADGA